MKQRWKMVRFGDIVQNIAVRVDPANADTDVYVGLEHLDPSTLHLHQWGHPSDVTGQKLTFKKGDVIFGRRRAYQRKLAVAEVDGICSAHAMVVRAKSQMILPEFLPFFLRSDMFMRRAIETSVGSLSPTINWKTFSAQEFLLPPLDEQKQIAETLWAMDGVVECFRKVENEMARMRNLYFHEHCLLGYRQHELKKMDQADRNWPVKKLSELINLSSKKSSHPHTHKEYIALDNMASGCFRITSKSNSSSTKSTCSVYKPGDILYGKLRPYLDKAVVMGSSGVCSTEILVMRGANELRDDYLIHHLHSPAFVDWNTHRAFGTRMPRTSAEIIGSYRIPVPPLDEQENLVSVLCNFLDMEECLRQHQASMRQLMKIFMDDSTKDRDDV